ncbi:hypothetical protein [Falsiroseomonas sp.]|uniref:hypothetical protein n=1 Tax=Falsiroseomonas sp. TaxID=2870721 RepID=UPI003564C019
MGQILLHRVRRLPGDAAHHDRPARPSTDALGPARGILCGVALSLVFWGGLALLLISTRG